MFPVEQEPIGYTYRPPQLMGVPDAFAVQAVGDSMVPMYRHGNLLWVHPHLAPTPGEGVLIVMNDDTAMVKEYVRRANGTLWVKEYRPEERVIAIPLETVRNIFSITGCVTQRL